MQGVMRRDKCNDVFYAVQLSGQNLWLQATEFTETIAARDPGRRII